MYLGANEITKAWASTGRDVNQAGGAVINCDSSAASAVGSPSTA
jgi:hypothetical protein